MSGTQGKDFCCNNILLLTNNPLVNDKIKTMELKFLKDYSYLELLYSARDFVHRGHKLLSHPLTSSIKPNETPYKSILISKNIDKLDFESLNFIESAIELVKGFKKNEHIEKYSLLVLEDFQLIDYSIICSGIDSIGNKI
ncbi:MAG: GrdX family protein [Fusobacteriaceae bacterium]